MHCKFVLRWAVRLVDVGGVGRLKDTRIFSFGLPTLFTFKFLLIMLLVKQNYNSNLMSKTRRRVFPQVVR